VLWFVLGRYFDFASDTLLAQSAPVLHKLAPDLQHIRTGDSINGYSDNIAGPTQSM
jgi:outer membrane protein OmpA-like peptidoglycan-associated protein